MRILIVEDNVAQIESLQLLLSSYGHTIYACQAVAAGKNLAQTHPPDAVVLDWIVPGNALEFVRWLRENPDTKNARIVVVTGLDKKDIPTSPEVPAMEGVTALVKPYEVEDLLRALGCPFTPVSFSPKGT